MNAALQNFSNPIRSFSSQIRKVPSAYLVLGSVALGAGGLASLGGCTPAPAPAMPVTVQVVPPRDGQPALNCASTFLRSTPPWYDLNDGYQGTIDPEILKRNYACVVEWTQFGNYTTANQKIFDNGTQILATVAGGAAQAIVSGLTQKWWGGGSGGSSGSTTIGLTVVGSAASQATSRGMAAAFSHLRPQDRAVAPMRSEKGEIRNYTVMQHGKDVYAAPMGQRGEVDHEHWHKVTLAQPGDKDCFTGPDGRSYKFQELPPDERNPGGPRADHGDQGGYDRSGSNPGGSQPVYGRPTEGYPRPGEQPRPGQGTGYPQTPGDQRGGGYPQPSGDQRGPRGGGQGSGAPDHGGGGEKMGGSQGGAPGGPPGGYQSTPQRGAPRTGICKGLEGCDTL